MRRLYKVLRALLLTIIIMLVVVPALVYVGLSLPSVQDRLRVVAEEMLSEKLGVEVTIGDLGIRPFNRAMLRNVVLVNQGDTLAKVERLGAGVNVYEIVAHGRVAVNYAELRGLDARLRRATPTSPLNIQPIIDALSNKDPNKPPTKFDVRVNTVVVRSSKVSYDIDSEPRKAGVLDHNHLSITDLRADITIPKLKNDDFEVDLKRLDFAEHSGLKVSNLCGHFALSDSQLSWKGLQLSMPRSYLSVNDASLQLDGIKSISSSLKRRGVNIGLKKGSHIYLPDLAALYPDFGSLTKTADVQLAAHLSPEHITLSSLQMRLPDELLRIDIEDTVVDHPLQRDSFAARLPKLHLAVERSLLDYLHSLPVNPTVAGRLPDKAVVDASATLTSLSGQFAGQMTLDDSTVDIDANYTRRDSVAPYHVNLTATTENLDLAKTLNNPDFGRISGDISAEATIGRRQLNATADMEVRDFDYRRHRYDLMTLTANLNGKEFDFDAALNDDAGTVAISAGGLLDKECPELTAHAEINNLDFSELNLSSKYPGHKLSATVDADFIGMIPDRSDGLLSISNLRFERPDGEALVVDRFDISSTAAESPRQIEISSDFLNGSFEGDFAFSSLVPEMKQILSRTFPTLLPYESTRELANNKFTFSLTLSDTESYREFLNLPFSAIYPVNIEGYVDGSTDYAQVVVDAPYLRQNNKLIENTNLVAVLNGETAQDQIYMTTRFPMKQGLTDLTVNATASDDTVDTSVAFHIDRPERYEGSLDFTAKLGLDDNRKPTADVDFHQSEIAFGDSIWTVAPSKVSYAGNVIDVDGFCLSRSGQHVKIDGRASADPDDKLTVDVLDLNLDYIFESIGITNVMLGGDATGVITASSLLTSAPRVLTEGDGIKVKNISYNKCVFGDAVVKSSFDVDDKAVVLDGTINQFNGRTAKVEGKIYAFTESLDIRLTCDQTPIGFMGYYMAAFASDVTGRGTGTGRLYGTFHDIDMDGDFFIEDMRLKINFTNTYYTATDSIHLRPHLITLKDLQLKDAYGHTATLNGELHHDYFRDPVFNFAITNAKGLLVYDEPSAPNADWYGHIFANGSATVEGKPGVVKIGADVTTSAGSKFTFVLSEREDADEYTFITFRDKEQLAAQIEAPKEDEEMSLVNHLREMMANTQSVVPTDYIIELKVDITPEAEIDLIMDPVAGDKIRSNGSGSMRMVYTSSDNDLQIFGKYTLDKGYYNFTLQDIIIKDFTIQEGSSISFTGDPLVARLDINASYALNANLSDLDESFLQDKDLNRTNVPVHALLKVTGDIQQPEIAFDLEFPTLTSDVDRKVRSIISTEEMMNRQIIYLLALNRFYTPDYMSTTKGNELFSVASSTISSQLSSILGQLSDNWAISPNFRSDRGDFSDVEVDLALSSRLLNNRLLLNGNFGYRDKSLNSTQFIGDFDLEYLLNREGTIRLKAYNHYNDQNYYLRTAATTQGVGVMFKRDFDNIFSFLRRKKATSTADDAAPTEASQESSDEQGASDASSAATPAASAPATAAPNDTIVIAPTATSATTDWLLLK